MTWKTWITWAVRQLLLSSSTPRYDAEIILSTIVNKSRTYILSFDDTVLDVRQLYKLNKLLIRRMLGEPIAHLIGFKEFWSLNFVVAPGTFIPRPDTECLVEEVLYELSNSRIEMLDLGTGVGTIAIAVASERSNWAITGVDCQNTSIFIAKRNLVLLGLDNILFICGNWFQFIQKKFDIIVSNPPYIDIKDPNLIKSQLNFESKVAFLAKNNGLEYLSMICHRSTKYLKPGGWLMLEHGWKQDKCVRALFANVGYSNIHTRYDYSNNARVTKGKWINKY